MSGTLAWCPQQHLGINKDVLQIRLVLKEYLRLFLC